MKNFTKVHAGARERFLEEARNLKWAEDDLEGHYCLVLAEITGLRNRYKNSPIHTFADRPTVTDFSDEFENLFKNYLFVLNDFNDAADSFAWLGHLVEEEAKKHGLRPIIPDNLEAWKHLTFEYLNEEDAE